MLEPTRERRLYELFTSATALEAPERAAFIDRECGDDEELREALEELLTEDDSDDSNLASSLGPETAAGQTLRSIPPTIGRYRIVSEIGRGGMGTVYLAEQDEPVRRLVALKVVRPGLDGDEIVRRFEAERQALAMMNHPGIAHVFDGGVSEDGRPYFVMEYVEGGRTLTEHVSLEDLTEDSRLRLFAQICDAVQHGHQKGVMHRDLKPANILVTRDGAPKIIDFGVARTFDEETMTTRLTQVGQIVGTLEYMSPEQCIGDLGAVDVRTDVYALGVILYELLTGQRPHDIKNKTLVEAARIIQEDPPRPTTHAGARIPADLATIVRKALEKEPERRYPSASGLALDVRRYLAREPISARPPSVFYQLKTMARRNRVLVGSLAAIFVIAITASVLSTGLWRDAVAATDLAEARNEELSTLLNIQNLRLAETAVRGSDGASARSFLRQIEPEARHWEWHYLWRMTDRSTRTIQAFHEKVVALKLTARGLMIGGEHGAIACIVPSSLGDPSIVGAAKQVARIDLPFDHLLLSRDGRSALAWHKDQRLRRWNLDEPEVAWETAPFPADTETLTWHQETETISAVVKGESRVHLIDGRSGRTLGDPLEFSGVVRKTRIHPSGERIIVQTTRARHDLAIPNGGRTEVPSSRPGQHLLPTRDDWFDAKGESLIEIRGGGLFVLDAASGDVTHRITLARTPIVARWLDEVRIVVLYDDGSLDFIDHVSVVRSEPGLSPARHLCVSEDGDWVATGDREGRVRVWDSVGTLSIGKTNDNLVGFSPGVGDVGPFSGGWGSVKRWSHHTGLEDWTTILERRVLNQIACRPDGQEIAVGGSWDKIVRLDANDGRIVDERALPNRSWCHALTYADGGALLVAAHSEFTLEAWDEGGTTSWAQSLPSRVTQLGVHARRIASGSMDGSVALRRVEDGEAIWETDPSGSKVTALAFSPDGTRLAVTTEAPSLALYDAENGELITAPHALVAEMFALVFSADGGRLVVGGKPESLFVFDAKRGTEIVRIHAGIATCTALSDGPNPGDLLMHDARGIHLIEAEPDAAISRDRWQGRRVRELVTELYRESFASKSMIERLERDSSLDPELRRDAIEHAIVRGDHPYWLNSDAWAIVILRGLDESEYRVALSKAEAAAATAPEDGGVRNTLGMAQLHAGRNEEALATFRLIDGANLSSEPTPLKWRDGSHPLDVACIAILLARLGDMEQARAELDRARRAAGTAPSVDAVTRRFLRYAESSIVDP